MSADNTDKTKPRKQFLNIVYFVESSRTRTLKIPMSRVHLLLFCALALVGWSVASTAIISLLVNDRAELVGSLKQTMQTVFDFESLYDGVYERAYPSGKLQSSKTLSASSGQAPNQKPTVAADTAPKSVANDSKQTEVEQQEQKAQTVAAAASTPAPEVNSSDSVGKNVEVTVSNPVVKTTDNRLNLTFDLTNKNGSEKSEGYIWATAEFKTETGDIHILKAPLSIEADSKGDITDHKRALFFAIRRFKRNEFSFDLMKGYSGTVVGVKIGVSDKPGANKMIYDVPLGIKVGNASQQNKKMVPAKKS
jgi:hypothetical protein